MPFVKSTSGNPAGKQKGAKDRFGHTRSAKAAVIALLDEFGGNTELLEQVIRRGLLAKARAYFPTSSWLWSIRRTRLSRPSS